MLIYERRRPRFPRTEDGLLHFVAYLMREYPAPYADPKTYGPDYSFGDSIMESLLTASKKKLAKLCLKHSLKTGSRKGMIRRMWLHWRAARLDRGYPYIGYGTGFENTRKPDCVCGYRMAIVRRFPRLIKSEDGRIRFPRPA